MYGVPARDLGISAGWWMPTSPTQWPDDPAPSNEFGNFQMLLLAAAAALPYLAADNLRLMLPASAPKPSREAARQSLDSAVLLLLLLLLLPLMPLRLLLLLLLLRCALIMLPAAARFSAASTSAPSECKCAPP